MVAPWENNPRKCDTRNAFSPIGAQIAFHALSLGDLLKNDSRNNSTNATADQPALRRPRGPTAETRREINSYLRPFRLLAMVFTARKATYFRAVIPRRAMCLVTGQMRLKQFADQIPNIVFLLKMHQHLQFLELFLTYVEV
jgi:hypothetical protein